MHENGELDIRFDDGDMKRRVDPIMVKKIGENSKKKNGNPNLRVAALGDEVVVVIDKSSKRPYCLPRSALSSVGFGSCFLSEKHLIRFLQCFGRICAIRGAGCESGGKKGAAAFAEEADPFSMSSLVSFSSKSDYEALTGSLDILSSYKRRKWEGEKLRRMAGSKSGVPSPTLEDLGTSEETQLTAICSAIDVAWQFSQFQGSRTSLYSKYADTFDRATVFALEGTWSRKNEHSLVKQVETLLAWKKDESAECWNETT